MLPTISDELMRQILPTARDYCVVILKTGPKRFEEGIQKVVWEHVRRNFAMRARGLLSIVCPVDDGSEVRGIGIFNASVEETKQLMDDDPGVKAGAFLYEIHPCKSFPRDSLPG